MKRYSWLLVLLVIACGSIFCAEDTVKQDSSFLIVILGHLTEIVITVLTMLFGWVINMARVKANNNQKVLEALDALKTGVEGAWNECGRKWKYASADGTLTEEEKAKLRALAIEKAKSIATGPAKDVLLTWGTDFCAMKIKEIIQNWKKTATPITPTTTTTTDTPTTTP